MLAESVNCLALLGILMEDVLLLKGFKLLQKAPSLPHLLADVHRILESLVPENKKACELNEGENDPKKGNGPDWNIKCPADSTKDVRFLEVNFLDKSSGYVPFCVSVHKIS